MTLGGIEAPATYHVQWHISHLFGSSEQPCELGGNYHLHFTDEETQEDMIIDPKYQGQD